MGKLSFAARANRYARDVVRGKIDACKYVQLACKRHLRDLELSKSKSYPYRFSESAARKICEFAENQVHVSGKWSGTFIVLEDWQVFLFAVGFGWVRRSDGMRRFREFYWEIPRKNAKSTKGAIIGNFLTFADDEKGAQVFSGATSMEQALKVFRPAWLMVQKNPEFRAHFRLGLSGTEENPGAIFQMHTGSRFVPIIGNPGDGDSPNGAIIDEFHEHKTSEQYNAMKTGMGARPNPLRAIITTAGVDTSGPCFDKHEEAIKVLEGTLQNEELFAVIYSIDLGDERVKGDDWTQLKTAMKANPNFGVSVFPDFIESQIRDAMNSVDQQASVLTKNYNVWQSAGQAWMNILKWNACADSSIRIESFAREKCWLAVDLASKINFASLAYIFKLKGGGHAFFVRNYLPAETVARPENAHFRRWRDEGWLIETPGPRTDFQRIEDDIKDAAKMFAVQELGFDQRESNYLISNIQDWCSFECIEVPQAPAHFNEPMKEMEAEIYAGTLVHCADPCLNWQMGNVVKKQSHSGGPVKYHYPTKTKEKNFIDGIVAGIMALGRAMQYKPKFASSTVRSLG